jgi:hypothetical protein
MASLLDTFCPSNRNGILTMNKYDCDNDGIADYTCEIDAQKRYVSSAAGGACADQLNGGRTFVQKATTTSDNSPGWSSTWSTQSWDDLGCKECKIQSEVAGSNLCREKVYPAGGFMYSKTFIMRDDPKLM